MTIAEAKQAVDDTSAKAVITAALARAKHDPDHALLSLLEDRALQRADAIDARRKHGDEIGPLAGVPFVAKDNFLTFGGMSTAAAKLLGNFEAPFQAKAIERLEAAGAICIAKANLDAFAHGGSTENSAYGPTTNPHDASRVAGGSSGGSAACVARGIVPFALGTDTGGSIRQPASFCGVVGLKPTYGSVSRWGVVAMASSTDVIGPLTTTSGDALTVMEVIAGQDEKDGTTITSPYASTDTAPVKKIGLITEWLSDGVDEEVRRTVMARVEQLRSGGYDVEEVSLPSLKHALAVYYVIVPAEIASNLARFDGIRYGARPDSLTELGAVYEQTRATGFMPENMRRIMIGNYVLSSGYYDAYFRQAAKVRTLIIQEFDRVLSEYDLLIGPVAPTPAFALGQNTHDPLSMYLADQMTVSASLAGLPALSVPLSVTGLPIGLQIIGRRAKDRQLLAFASQMEMSA
ncbi:MAG TPA: Asp-tRNA(Asn)/Glu-tRNA(Gln) amidotransferase subunit GatA [Candidatus Saccharimonadales bacterium]|jgi:aspartyl-tRNA(Asn)/glutamyl-tRNA(Gln) amidotransferase subunit A